MKKITDILEETFTDITFAEEREIRPVNGLFKKASARLEEMLVEIAFAEERDFGLPNKSIHKQGRGYSASGLDHCCTGRA